MEAMEVDQDPEVSIKETLLYMEFDQKVKDYLFDDKIFFRMARLEESPLVQFNNHLFKGEYKSCLGTNLFFSDCDNSSSHNLFELGSSMKLKHQATQCKVLELKPVRIPSDMAELPQPIHDIKINKRYDYKTLLKKFAYGSLNLKEDLAVVPREKDPQPIEQEQKREKGQDVCKPELSKAVLKTKGQKVSSKVEKQSDSASEGGTQSNKPKKADFIVVDILTFKLEKLKKLSLRPTRRKKEFEPVEECEEKYKEAYAYNSLKCSIMKPSDYFRTISEKFNEKTLVGAVDVDRSVLQGVIDNSPNFHRVLSEEEKSALMSIKNFENLSMPARYIVIKSHLEHLESTIPTLLKDELFEKDSHGRTIRETIKIYKRLLRVIGGLVKREYCYDSDDENKS
ncbi:uncharacterized protein LOC123314901 [Coccinella septempunctata]|uniref:uncharacterized protein LOC123314901 n=1 Tax=Coccinella septempunctata TaxID=41139 RepID=UPI001D07D565|nr:uncharacterized protein LOC123314901 [Coccinella septempunctata]XP_044756285.1 uncharacterized protein LOC123314901 [Coccinella septempunctata]